MTSSVPRRGQPLQPRNRFIALCTAAALTWRLAWPSAFFESSPGPARSSPAHGQRRNLAHGPNFLKILLSTNQRCQPLELEKKHDAVVKLSGIGEYFPYRVRAHKVLLVAGEQENVLAVLEEVFSEASDEKISVSFLVPRSTGGLLIGNGGEKIRKIEEATSAVIGVESKGFEEVVDVYGTRQSIKAVAEWLLGEQDEFVDEMKEHLTVNYLGVKARGLDASASIYVAIPQDKARQLMGKGGTMINSIAKEFAVRLSLDRQLRDEDGNEILKITGPVGSVHAAHASILNRFVFAQPERTFRKRQARQASVAEAADVLSAASAESVNSVREPAPVGVGSV